MKQSGTQSHLPKGTRIMASSPFCYVLKSSFQGSLCDCCLQKRNDLRRCTGCLFVWYCGKACQRQAWPVHKGECKNLAKVRPKIPPDAVRLIAQIVLKLKHNIDDGEHIPGTNIHRRFKDLMSHYKEIKEDGKRMEHLNAISHVLQDYLGESNLPNFAELCGIYGRVCVNSFNIVNGEMQTVGTGIYLGPSIIDHSCSPNAVVTFEGPILHVQLTEDLPALDWSTIRISYIDLMNSTSERVAELRERYYFECDCQRCHDTAIDQYHYAAKCPDCSKAIILMKGGINPYTCPCGYCLGSQHLHRFWEAAEYSEQQLRLMQDVNYLDVCQICLDKQGDSFHDLCLIRSKMLDAAFDCCIQLHLWEKATEYGTSLIESYRLWYGPYHPLTAVLYLKLVKLLSLNREVDRSLQAKYLHESLSILEVTHGKSSSFYQEEALPLLHQIN